MNNTYTKLLIVSNDFNTEFYQLSNVDRDTYHFLNKSEERYIAGLDDDEQCNALVKLLEEDIYGGEFDYDYPDGCNFDDIEITRIHEACDVEGGLTDAIVLLRSVDKI